MTDHNREALIEEAARVIRGVYGDQVEDTSAVARAVFAVFEKTLAPTDDEREALARLFDAHWMTPLGKCACGWVHPQYGMRASHLDPIYVRQHLAYVVSNAGYRRSEVPEPQGEPSDAQEGESRGNS